MATQLGNVEITEVKGDTFTGVFESVYNGSVGHGSRWIAASIIIDAWDQFEPAGERWDYLVKTAQRESQAPLAAYIESCLFETPNRKKTKFVIKVTNPALIEKFKPVSWESYLVG